MLTNRKSKHYHDADADDEFDERRPLKIQKLMTMMKLDDDHPPPPLWPPPLNSIHHEEEEEEEGESNKDNSSIIGVRWVRMMTKKEKEEIMEVPWDVLTPQVLQLIANRLKLFHHYSPGIGVGDSIDVVIQLDLGGGTVSNVPLIFTPTQATYT